MSGEDQSKDEFFRRIGVMADEMIAVHGKDFTMGTFILAARFIAEGKKLVPAGSDTRPLQ